jgi:hypothetical protein
MKPAEASLPSDTEVLVKRSFDALVKLVWRAYTVTFQEANGITNVTTTIRYASKADRDAAFATGMTDGMEMSYKQLDGVLGEM